MGVYSVIIDLVLNPSDEIAKEATWIMSNIVFEGEEPLTYLMMDNEVITFHFTSSHILFIQFLLIAKF